MNKYDHDNKLDIDKAYVSPDDRFLFTFDANHAKSASQLKEIKKHERIAKLRDQPTDTAGDEAVWGNF